MRNAHALDLARRAVAASSVKAVAGLIGYHPSTLSRYMNEVDYPSPLPVEAAIRDHLDSRTCPRTGHEISADQCRTRALAPRPFGGNAREQHWLFCQQCPHKPQGDQP